MRRLIARMPRISRPRLISGSTYDCFKCRSEMARLVPGLCMQLRDAGAWRDTYRRQHEGDQVALDDMRRQIKDLEQQLAVARGDVPF